MQPCADLLEKNAALDCTLNYSRLINTPIILSNRHGELKLSARLHPVLRLVMRCRCACTAACVLLPLGLIEHSVSSAVRWRTERNGQNRTVSLSSNSSVFSYCTGVLQFVSSVTVLESCSMCLQLLYWSPAVCVFSYCTGVLQYVSSVTVLESCSMCLQLLYRSL